MMKQSLLGVAIETSRLRLEAISSDYKYPMFETFTDNVARYLSLQPFRSVDAAQLLALDYRQDMMRGNSLQLVMIDKGFGTFVGCAGLICLDEVPRPGLWIRESVWGQGYGFETLSALKWWADENLTCECLYYRVAKENFSSRRIAEKLGGQLRKEEYIFKNANNESMAMVEYRIKRV